MPSFIYSAQDVNGRCSPMISLPHQTVYKYFHKWQRKGIWQQVHDGLRKEVRKKIGRTPNSTVAMVDSQSVKTTEKRGRYMTLMVARKLKDVNGIS
ncbi:transposase [Synechocystis sp. PCC 6803]|uniref:Transposase n=1 Tax=Synechocystis sp. (strain ATCC 27184 / PCC 6803 / Kazusa) TaxID=1111708 RepID=P74026_SYNY3|nr:transposase [Synechocystis sp. PCC 6803]BAL29271.1 transposase [Synechocystis sp. PCC 6803 substr. GT-I]BAL32440.1 transposase [Synechocystis sp. PCC 6803 substr. PCC-N]BAL35609.1 transposase [Synechocystis sp. PCC 6803 substr. PCC-P]ALJ67773.1 transposase [Synechocystis sp. PCC 6803]